MKFLAALQSRNFPFDSKKTLAGLAVLDFPPLRWAWGGENRSWGGSGAVRTSQGKCQPNFTTGVGTSLRLHGIGILRSAQPPCRLCRDPRKLPGTAAIEQRANRLSDLLQFSLHPRMSASRWGRSSSLVDAGNAFRGPGKRSGIGWGPLCFFFPTQSPQFLILSNPNRIES